MCSIVPAVILLAVSLKLHQRQKLHRLLLSGIILVPLMSLPMMLLAVLGVERTQELLSQLFPEANNPNGSFTSSYQVDRIEVGPVYLMVMQVSYLLPGIAMFVLGFGVFLQARLQTRAQHESSIQDHVL
jgi:hypothetical protein